MPLAPEAKQSELNEGDAWMSVVAFAEVGNESLHRHQHLRVVVVRAPASTMVGIFFFAYPLGSQPIGQTRWFLRVISVNPDNNVFSLGQRVGPCLLLPSLEGIVVLGWLELLPRDILKHHGVGSMNFTCIRIEAIPLEGVVQGTESLFWPGDDESIFGYGCLLFGMQKWKEQKGDGHFG